MTKKQRIIGYTLAGAVLLSSACNLGRLVYYPPGSTAETQAQGSFKNLFACGPGLACLEGQLGYEQSPEWVQHMFADGSWVEVSEGTIVGADDQAVITAPDGQQYTAGLDQSEWLRLGAGRYHVRVTNTGLQQWVRFIGDVQPVPQQ